MEGNVLHVGNLVIEVQGYVDKAVFNDDNINEKVIFIFAVGAKAPKKMFQVDEDHSFDFYSAETKD